MGMESLREIYRIGKGPSSSHTMGPEKACKLMLERNPNADSFKVILFGSLAFTGLGHGTDRVIKETLGEDRTEVLFNYEEKNLPHPNTLDIFAYENNKEVDRLRVMSVGGGRIEVEGKESISEPEIYELDTFKEITDFCWENDIEIWQYVEAIEDEDFEKYMLKVWQVMKDSIERGLKDEGVLPGGLDVQKKAKKLFNSRDDYESAETRENRLVCSYAFAVSEQNAGANTIVTAPTCGAAGIVPSVLYYYQLKNGYSDKEIIHALYTGGIVGNLVKTNASISGAECGCQAEVGTACAMAAAALAQLLSYDFDEIDCAAEIAIEHHLGLTCDPILGLVQIPCIERNAVASMRAINSVSLASFLSDSRKMTLDDVILVMKETGLDLAPAYRETAEGGLAKVQELRKELAKKITELKIINKK